MKLWTREKPERSSVEDDLRSAARRLTGWTVSGTEGVDLPYLLRLAANEIRALRVESSGHSPRD